MHAGARPQIFRNALKLRNKMTEAEELLWQYFREKPSGYKIRRQHPIHIYILDFYCHKYRLAVEIDGDYHLKPEQRLKDKVRFKYLKSVGIRVIRFTNNQVLEDIDEVKQSVMNELIKASNSKK